MTMNVEIPTEVQPLIAAAVAEGRFTNEQELVSEILRVTVPVLEDYDRLRREVKVSLDMADRGEIREADFEAVRRRLCDEYDEFGGRK
jgi:Arc/MetJ-type ribon-helix-helix transcriptional regulator